MGNEGPHPLDLEATLKRMEPGVSPIQEVAITSLAISMKRIADNMERMTLAIESMRYSIQNNGDKISNSLNGMQMGTPAMMGAANRVADTMQICSVFLQQIAEKGKTP